VYAGPSVTSGIVKFLKREEVVEILLAHGADGKAKNKDGLTAPGVIEENHRRPQKVARRGARGKSERGPGRASERPGKA
jgi:hypothetical protein